MTASLLLDLDQNLTDIKKSVKGLNTDLKISTAQFKLASNSADKFGKSLQVIGVSAKGVVGTLLALSDISFKLDVLTKIGEAGFKAWKEFGSVTKTVTFEEAIQGSSELKDNLETLEATSNSVIGSIQQGFSVLFDNDNFNKFAAKSVKAYADVEQAAYRLGTVSVTGNEKSIDSIDKNIKSMKELQKATNDALGSVQILNAQYDIASAGFGNKKDNLNVGKAAINLGQAGFGDLGGSTNAVVRALRALGDSSEAADKRAAQLFETTKVGLLTLDQLTPSVGGLAVQSKQLGIDFSEMLGAIAGLTTQGVSADEAANRLTSLLSDITAGSQEANLYLSKFRDEAGKPIQINATVLKDKGLAGVLDDLQKATGGRPENIQKIFTNQMSVEAVQLFSSLGKKTLQQYSGQIKEADPGKLEEEAKGRSQTVTGAFEQARIKSQEGVEDFGKGVAPSVVESIAKTNEVTEAFTTGAAEGIGKVAGALQGLQTKFSAIGGFFGSVFSAAAPLILIAAIGKIGGEFKKTFGNARKDGESIWDTIKRKAVESITTIKEKIIEAAKLAVAEVRKIQSELDRTSFEQQFTAAAAKTPEYAKAKQRDLDKEQLLNPKKGQSGDLVKDLEDSTYSNPDFVRDLESGVDKQKQKYRDIGFSESDIKDIEEAQSKKVKAAQSKAMRSGFKDRAGGAISDFKESFSARAKSLREGLGDRAGSVRESASKLISSQKDVLSKGGIGGFLNQSLSVPLKAPEGLTKFLSSSPIKAGGAVMKGLAGGIGVVAKGLAGLGVVGIAAAFGIQVVTGWASTFSEMLNKSTNPNIKAMGEAINGLNKEILDSSPNLKLLADDLEGLNSATAKTGNGFLDFAGQVGKNFSDSMRFVTGGMAKYGMVAAEADKAQTALNSKISSFSGKETGSGKLSLEGTAAKAKLDKGQIITPQDEQALQKELGLEKELLDARVAIAQQKYDAAKASGGQKDIADAEAALKVTKGEVEQQKKFREERLKATLGTNLIKKFNSIDTSVPLALSISKQNESAVLSQISDVGKKASEVFSGKLLDPSKFYDLIPQISNSLGAIETQVSLDPASANKLLSDLEGTLNAAGADFNKLLASDPGLRKRYTELKTAITEANQSVLQFQQSSDTAILNVLKSSGVARGGLTKQLDELLQKNLTAQIDNIKKELEDPATAAPRKAELQSKVAELQAQKLSTALENAAASVDEEYAARNKLIEQTNKVADQFESLASNSLFSGSIASSGFKRLATQIKNPDRQIDTEANQAIDKANAKVKALEDALASASGEQAEQIGKALDAAKKELPSEVSSIKTEAALKKVNAAAEAAALKIEEENQVRDNQIAANERVITSFNNLSSTAGSLFKTSSVGSTLSRISTTATASLNKPGAEYDKEVRTIDARIDAAQKAAEGIKKSGASDETVREAQAIAERTRVEGEAQKSAAAQSLALETVNQKLTVFASRVAEVTDKIGKQADLFKDKLDFDQKQREVASENNKSISSLQSGLLGFLGQNNPAANIVQQRLDVKQSKEDDKIKLAQSRTESKKEIIDLKVMDLQLELEQKAYENSLTQTALLSDLVSVASGGKAQFNASDEIKKQLQGLPAAFKEGQQFTAARQQLNRQKIDSVFTNQDLTELNIRREGAKNRLGILGQNRSPANFDLQKEALLDTKNLLRNSKEINYDSTPLRQDKSFGQMLDTLNSIRDGGGLRGLPNSNPATQGTSSPNVALSPNVQVNINVSKEDAAKLGDITNQVKTQINKGLEITSTQMSQQLLKYARGV
jgi:TP901 family phage tail tape measure protein